MWSPHVWRANYTVKKNLTIRKHFPSVWKTQCFYFDRKILVEPEARQGDMEDKVSRVNMLEFQTGPNLKQVQKIFHSTEWIFVHETLDIWTFIKETFCIHEVPSRSLFLDIKERCVGTQQCLPLNYFHWTQNNSAKNTSMRVQEPRLFCYYWTNKPQISFSLGYWHLFPPLNYKGPWKHLSFS
jgi:hypothetical protein